ncbi:hypothetical protein ON010_g19065 [Phytophthora cinnamomi]|nr:hypothetical protein ON010_g19065 [Phytophthora cinnamomi]
MNGHGGDFRAGTGRKIADVALPPQTKGPAPPILLLSQSNGGFKHAAKAGAHFDELIDAVTAAYWELPPSTIMPRS